jgi:hypothetical protein
LDSAEELHAQHPDTFSIPSREERTTLRVGARVQLVFLLRGTPRGQPVIQGERMWVTIQKVQGGRYVGTLTSDPATSRVLQPGDQIEFGPEHVACVLIPITDPRHPNYDPKSTDKKRKDKK